ncbi:MAG: diaminobutyrate--2-oxoglutarate transaminase [Nitrosopumilus sp.]|nr:diaminobutyrate--2-oxoglutarate transaminase [Nitrosopumilus sp.]
MKQINSLESEVRSYCRAYPVMFEKAKGPYLIDNDGKMYLDFLCGAGSLNYGHNNPVLKNKIIEYLNQDGIIHSLDLATESKEDFLKSFSKNILSPRNLNYKAQFTGPTGTNAVEAALKIARKVTGRTKIISFTNGFHGVTLGAVAATGNSHHRGGAGVSLNEVVFMPYDGYMGNKVSTIDYFRRLLEDNSSGVDLPAAVILETVQGEGGINVASSKWLQSLQEVCQEFGILIIVDDIQVGCGRTGSFFSFEGMGIEPDIVTLSKSLSGFGLPFSLLLLKPELDQWKPGEHNGTFRGNNMAFVTAKAAIEQYWTTYEFEKHIALKSNILKSRLEEISSKFPISDIQVRGKGMIYGIDCILENLASEIRQKCFENGLILETCGSDDQVVKLLPPLNISENKLHKGLNILEKSIAEIVQESNFDKKLTAEVVQN